MITPDLVAVGVDVLVDHPVGVDVAFHHGRDVRPILLAVVRVGHLIPGLLQQHVGVIAQEPTHLMVDLLDATLRIHQAHADARAFHRTAETFIGLGLPSAGFLRRLLRGHFLVDQMGRDDSAVAVSLGIEEGLDVDVEPMRHASYRAHPHPLADDPARGDLLPSVDVSLRIL